MSDENKEKKDIEVVEGIGNLDISPVYENLTTMKPKMKDEKPKAIVIPQVKKTESKDKVDVDDQKEKIEDEKHDDEEKIDEEKHDDEDSIDDDIDDADEDEIDDLIEINDLLDFDVDVDSDDDIDNNED